MSNQIHNHYDYDDIQKMYIQKDVKIWKDELSIIAEELSLAKEVFVEYIKNARLSYDNILNSIHDFSQLNENFQEDLSNYTSGLESLKECDDLQCETYFVNDHKDFKNRIDQYFDKYRQFKRQVILKIRR